MESIGYIVLRKFKWARETSEFHSGIREILDKLKASMPEHKILLANFREDSEFAYEDIVLDIRGSLEAVRL